MSSIVMGTENILNLIQIRLNKFIMDQVQKLGGA